MERVQVKRLGIMGGTFDPIHYGHLVTAEAARTLFHLDQVIFVPSGRPPHKRERNTPGDDDAASHHYESTFFLFPSGTGPRRIFLFL